ncbi:hypothetical protein QVD17_24524 [Tagetes erecta]|uniref:Uncharacterized protein n=1 Tax=Tagetes erecta TaxID=13708 RepID=A0AAD8KI71_TARER|nr:hypothetical protein QVD17_24524 [Tagetes erecta]
MAGTKNIRGGGRSGRKGKPPGKKKTVEDDHEESVRTETIRTETEGSSRHTDEGFTLEPVVRKAIADEVYQVMQRTLPLIMTEALKTVTKELEQENEDEMNNQKKEAEAKKTKHKGNGDDVDSEDEMVKGCSLPVDS